MSSLRLKAPHLYEKMIEVFSNYHLHPYVTVATAEEKEGGLEVSVMLSGSQEKVASMVLSDNMTEEKIDAFFDKVANECQQLLISNFYQMMKL